MHKHNGIVVVAILRGQPRSEVVAALERAHLGELFTTDVHCQVDGEQGVAANVNLIDEAIALVDDLACENIGSVLIPQGSKHSWVVS